MEVLAFELALSGVEGQAYSGLGEEFVVGPAFIGYYSPAFLRKNADSLAHARVALAVLADVYRAARRLWPMSAAHASSSVTLMLEQLKAPRLDDVSSAYGSGDCWLLARTTAESGTVERHPLADLQSLMTEREVSLLPYWRAACSLSDAAATSDANAKQTYVV